MWFDYDLNWIYLDRLYPQKPHFMLYNLDECLMDRKLIERLLKTSSYQGILLVTDIFFLFFWSFDFYWFSWSGVLNFLVFPSGFCVFIVTAVDSGSKALEFLGIHDEEGTSSSGSSESQVIESFVMILGKMQLFSV